MAEPVEMASVAANSPSWHGGYHGGHCSHRSAWAWISVLSALSNTSDDDTFWRCDLGKYLEIQAVAPL